MQTKPAVILVVEDSFELRTAMAGALRDHGFEVRAFASGEEALQAVDIERPDLILLDNGLPRMSGFDVYQELQRRDSPAPIPVIFVSGHADENLVVNGLELGAEDFITKPFRIQVLLARVRRALERSRPGAPKTQAPNRQRLCFPQGGADAVVVNGERVALTPLERETLELLLSQPGWVFSRRQLVERLEDLSADGRSVEAIIDGLRAKLGPDAGASIEVVKGIGFRITG